MTYVIGLWRGSVLSIESEEENIRQEKMVYFLSDFYLFIF